MSKSLAETVNFGKAVQAKQYEKRAQQVDTFVRSETAQQKLARSGKAKTAEAITSLVALGGSYLDHKAKAREQEVRVIRDELANMTATMLEEHRNGDKPFESETFADLPLRFQKRVVMSIGEKEAARENAEMFAGITDEMLLNSEALAEHTATFTNEPVVVTAMDAFRNTAYTATRQQGHDKLNNMVIKATTLQNEQEVKDEYTNAFAQVIQAQNEILINNQVITGNPPSDEDMRVSARNTYIATEAHFNNTAGIDGVLIPQSIRKVLARDAIIAAASASGNHYLLQPDLIPPAYKDDKTLWLFQKARLDIIDKREAGLRQDKADANAQWYADTRQAATDAHEGTITRDTPKLTVIQLKAIIDAETRDDTSALASNSNAIAFGDQIQLSVADPQKRGLLLDKNGDPVLDAAGNTVALRKDSLNAYVSSITNINVGDAKGIQNAMDENLVGFDVSQYLSKAPLQNARTVLTNKLKMVNPLMQGEFQVEMEDRFKEIYSSHFYQAKKTKGFSTPLNHQEREDVRIQAHSEFLTEVTARVKEGFTPAEIDLEGNEVGKVEEENQTEKVDAEVYTPEPNQDAFDAMTDAQQAYYHANKNIPKFMRAYIDAGNPLPNSEEEESQGNYDEVRADVDMSDEDLEDMLFGVANWEYGDGLRSTASMARSKFTKLDSGTRKVLMDKFINTKANEFVGLLNGFYNKTFNPSLRASYEADIKEVLEDPKNVMKMDSFLKGTLKNSSVIQGKGTDDPIPWIEQLKRTTWYKED